MTRRGIFLKNELLLRMFHSWNKRVAIKILSIPYFISYFHAQTVFRWDNIIMPLQRKYMK